MGEQYEVPSQDAYESETTDTRWVPLEEHGGDAAFEVQTMPPLQFLRDARRHGVLSLFGGDGDGDTDDVDDDDVQQLILSGAFDAFVEDVIVDRVVQPENVYWDPQKNQADRGGWDLAALDPNDLMAVAVGLTGQDADDLQEMSDDKFRGDS